MRSTIIILFCFIACTKPSAYVTQIEQQREQKKADFLNPATSILDADELSSAKGLLFFPPDESYIVNAVLTALPHSPEFDMEHSNDKKRKYRKYGDISFMLKEKNFVLPVYTNATLEEENLVFFPFTDLTNGKSTYGGGRYLDVPAKPGKVDIDFNQCYNPYCAYSHRYSCPIVPKENHMDMEIKAGEKLAE